MNLSIHFTLDELIASETASRFGIDNTPPSDVVERLRLLCLTVLEPIRAHFGPVHINSGYRCLEVNRRVGSKDTSQHVLGEAADLVIVGVKPIVVCQWVVDSGIEYDQTIMEFGAWTHISKKMVGNRKSALTIDRFGTRLGLHEVRT